MRAHGAQPARQAGEQSTAGRPGAPGGAAARMLSLQRLAGNAAVARAVQRSRHEHGPGCGHADPEADVQRSVDLESPEAAPSRVSVNDAINTPHKPLPAHIQRTAEQAYGRSFGNVKVHDNAVAQESAKNQGADAYTTGEHIVVRPEAMDDAKYLHETHHTVQQSLGKVAGTDNGFGESVSSPDHPEEIEAAAMGEHLARGGFF
ncbi:hypothetical protein SUDANB145_04062 [Streptomyces sp. enrichment culture]|uniref:eCIS core domain-containing protein n=1 Tax=Streptomyces sp. enrichment culture TaxID=1795815 RepID=UPI003F5532D3